MESIENDVKKELLDLIHKFENLEGEDMLEFVKIVFEKIENGEIVINEKEITSADLGIEDGYACCRNIIKVLNNSKRE